MDARLEGKPARPRPAASPLSPTVFLRRNAGKTIPLVAVITLAVLLVASIIALIDSIPYSIRTIYDYSKHMVGITPRGDPTATPRLVEEVRQGSPVPIDRVVICRSSGAEIQSIVGKWPYAVMGLTQDDLRYFLRREGSRGIVGRLPTPGAPEAIVSRPVARNLNLTVFDPTDSPKQKQRAILQAPDRSSAYSPYPVKVVGIVDTERWLMLGNIEYMRANHFPPIDLALVFAKNAADQKRLDQWCLDHFKGRRAQIFAYQKIEKDTNQMFNTLFMILNVVIGTLVTIVTIMMAMLINIYQSQRLVEFGLLQAIGYTKRQILTRVLTETVLVILGGWALGLVASIGALKLVDLLLMQPKAYQLEIFDAKAYLYTVPLPICILLVAGGSVWLRFHRFDPVGVVERRLV